MSNCDIIISSVGDAMKRIVITLPDKLHKAAKIKAAQTGISIAEICRRALAKWVKDNERDYEELQQKLPGI
jgi:plasmid stability protein